MKCPTLKELPLPPKGKIGWPWNEESKLNMPAFIKGDVWPTISIVTPSYNQGEFLEETIRSILLQGYPNLDYIIIDGNSTDRSIKIIKKYQKWLSYWVSESDHGQSEAINKGWKRSKGEILAWLNSDDIYAANTLIKIAEFFQSNKNIDMVYGNCNLIDECGDFIKTAPAKEFSLKLLVNNKWFIPQQATFIRSNVVKKIGGLDETLHLVMDWEYWLRIALNNFKIQHFSEVLSSYRLYQNAKTSSQSIRSGQEKIRVLKRIYRNKEFEQSIMPYKDGAFSYVHIWSGKKLCKGKQRWKAFWHFLASIRYCPFLITRKYFVQMVVDCAKGKSIK